MKVTDDIIKATILKLCEIAEEDLITWLDPAKDEAINDETMNRLINYVISILTSFSFSYMNRFLTTGNIFTMEQRRDVAGEFMRHFLASYEKEKENLINVQKT